MKTELKDVIHLYLGCEMDISLTEYGQAETKSGRLKSCILRGTKKDKDKTLVILETNLKVHAEGWLWLDISVVKPILSRIEDMTEGGVIDLIKIEYASYPGDIEIKAINDRSRIRGGWTFSIYIEKKHQLTSTLSLYRATPEQFQYLLKNSFDLYGLIDSGQSIDAKSFGEKV